MSSAQQDISGDSFSIRVTADLTGISAHKLRMWQRRYGFPDPARTPGGARRYSEEDVATLKLIARALGLGFRAGEVVGKSRPDLERLLAKRVSVPIARGQPPELSGVLELIERDQVDAVREHLRQAAATLGAKRFVTDFAQPLAVAVGERWQGGTLSIQQEHFASNMLATQLRVLASAYHSLGGSPRVLLSALENEHHGLGLEMVALYLALSGASPKLLGAHTPAEAIIGAATALKVDVIGISVSAAAEPKPTNKQLSKLNRKLPQGMQLWIGGGGAQALRMPAGAHRLSDWASCDERLSAWRLGR